MEAFLEERLDIVSICTPPWTHHPLALRFFERGCHVLTEKPMAMSGEEAAGMIDAARLAGTSLCVSHNFLFSRSMLRAERLIQRGEVGAIQHVVGLQLSSPSRRLPTWYADLPGGLFFDEAPHLVYLMRRFLGGLQVDFASVDRAQAGQQPVAHVQARLSGRTASGLLTMSFLAPVSEWVVLVVGSERVLMLDIFRDILAVLRPDGSHSPREVLSSSLRFALGLAKGFLTSGSLYASRHLLYGHDVLIGRFVDSILNGDPPPVGGEDGRQVVQAMRDILRTAGYGTPSRFSDARV
jgi:predicted dehydrogenase